MTDSATAFGGSEMNRKASTMWTWTWPAVVFLAVIDTCVLGPSLHADTKVQGYEIMLPALNPAIPPLAAENRRLLLERLVAAFERDYAVHVARNEGRLLCDGMAVYHLQRELQACIDMWRATGNSAYLEQAMSLVLCAVEEARGNPRPLMWHGQSRGERPCFYFDTVAAQTGGHSQLCDFQGGAGFLAVARVLHELDLPESRQIADFVEQDIVGKWLCYNPSIKPEHLTGPESLKYLPVVLNSCRAVREHFACICLDLHAMGYDSYPYRDWAKLLIDLYLTPRYDPRQLAPYEDLMPERIPRDWGLPVETTADGVVWLSIADLDPNNPTGALDTSHANRTAWLAAKAYAEGLVDRSVLDGLANTLRYRIWAPEKGPFYFNNYVDGSDFKLGGLDAGRAGNIWFGWHRLAASNRDMEELFLSIAYDLTNGGPNLPDRAQNKTMQEAPLCLEAWAARLLTASQTRTFP